MENIDELLWGALEGTQVPSLAAAVIVDGELHAAGAAGVRKRGDATPVTVNDKYHIGSCTKAMTTTLAGILVERGWCLGSRASKVSFQKWSFTRL